MESPFDSADWHSTPGTGNIRTWRINDVCTRLEIVRRDGSTLHHRLKQFEFQNGDHFFLSMLPLGTELLCVTHQHGGFVVEATGKVRSVMGLRKPVERLVSRGHVRRVAQLPGPFEEGPGNRLIARCWNGRTLAATYAETEYAYLVLMDARLNRHCALQFDGERIVRVETLGTQGYRIALRQQTWRIDNQGAARRV